MPGEVDHIGIIQPTTRGKGPKMPILRNVTIFAVRKNISKV